MNTSTGELQGGEMIKAVIWSLWGKQEVGLLGFLSSFEARKMAWQIRVERRCPILRPIGTSRMLLYRDHDVYGLSVLLFAV